MSAVNIDAKTAQQLEEELEVAFREGEVGETALLAWELKARFPRESGVASIYIKKLLRDPYVAGISLEDFKKNAKSLRDEDEPEELASSQRWVYYAFLLSVIYHCLYLKPPKD